MEEIINSVMQSPENTNPNVLRSQLQNMGGSGEGLFIVTIQQNGTGYVADKSPSDILEAWNSGKYIIAEVPAYTLFLPMSNPNDAGFAGINLQIPNYEEIISAIFVYIKVQEDKTCLVLTKTLSLTTNDA